MKKLLSYIILLALLLVPIVSYGTSDSRLAIIILDEINFREIGELGLDKYGLGLMNRKTRKPDNDSSFYSTLNVGRKVSLKKLKEDKLDTNFLGDQLRGRIAYFGQEEDELGQLVMDSSFRAENIDQELTASSLEENFRKYDVLAGEYSLLEGGREEFQRILGLEADFYIVAKQVGPEDVDYLNKNLVPVILTARRGILSSSSTKRKGLIAMEDIAVDIKAGFNIPRNSLDIGQKIGASQEGDSLEFIENFYRENNRRAYISYFLHGLIYLAQVLLLISIFRGKNKTQSRKFYVFATNNIVLSLLMGMTNYSWKLAVYLGLLIGLNLLLTSLVFRTREAFKLLNLVNYLLISLAMVFQPDIIYRSYIGFNNLMYGVRFYGFNNAMAGAYLGSSIVLIASIEGTGLNRYLRKILILLVCLANIFILSSEYGANTGAFITSILLACLVGYYYLVPREWNHRSILYGLLVLAIVLGLSFYLKNREVRGHALSFLERIRDNGGKEFFYMAGFKLRELLKFTLMPPFSLVILSQILIIKKLYTAGNRSLRLLLLTSILGYLINDTGNVLLIYMLNYGILILLYGELGARGSIFMRE